MAQFINGAWRVVPAHEAFDDFPDIAADVADLLRMVEAAEPIEYDPETLVDLAETLAKTAIAVAKAARTLHDSRKAVGIYE